MTFDEVADTLPNGFHDAELLQLSLDAAAHTATLKLSIWMSMATDDDGELYRNGILRADSVALFFVEPPDTRYGHLSNDDRMWCSGDAVSLGQKGAVDPLLSTLPEGSTSYRFFLVNWNSFLYLSAASVTFTWDD